MYTNPSENNALTIRSIFFYLIGKGGRSANKFRNSQVRKFAILKIV